MDKWFGGEPEPSPESMRAFSELVDREAHRQRMLDEGRSSGWPPPAVKSTAWQPLFEMEDFGCTPSVGRLEKPAGKSSATTGAESGLWDEGVKGKRKGIKRTREVSLLVVDGEEKVQKKAATREKVVKWDLNKRVEFSDEIAS